MEVAEGKQMLTHQTPLLPPHTMMNFPFKSFHLGILFYFYVPEFEFLHCKAALIMLLTAFKG